MTISMYCPGCERRLEIKERLLGRTIACPACKTPFIARAQAVTGAVVGQDGSASPAPAHGAAGQIGRFKIESALGRGAFGSVYKAHDPVLNRSVALKVPRADLQGAERLVREAQAAAALRHPSLVAVYEAGADGDQVYIATEYVQGQTLADRLKEPVDHRTAAEWVQSLAAGLAYAHREGVVHRDVKPQNVMVSAEGRPQLMDFGLARTTAHDPGSEGVVGTPGFMAPEQARGDAQQVGPASDQYSLGAVLYQLLTGNAPFGAGPETIAEVASGATPPAPRSIRREIPVDLEAICLKAMAKDPGGRYGDCQLLAEDLGRWLNDELVRARRYTPLELAAYWARKRPAVFGWVTAASLLAALLLVGATAYATQVVFQRSSTNEAQVVPSSPDPASSSQVSTTTTDGDREAEMVRYGRQLDRTYHAFRQHDVVDASRELEQTRWDYRNWEYNYLRRIVTGGLKTIHGHDGEVTALAIHPDGTRFVSAGMDRTVCVWDMATGRAIQRMMTPGFVRSVAYSPDGKTVIMGTGYAPHGASPPHVNAPAAAAPAGPAPAAAAPAAATAMPDAGAVAQLCDDRVPSSVPAPQVPFPQAEPAVAADNSAVPNVAVAAVERFHLFLCDSESLARIAARDLDGPISSVAFSPDGRSIAIGATFHASPGTIHIANSRSLEDSILLVGGSGSFPKLGFTTDGTHIAATAGKGGVHIWALPALSTGDAVARTVVPPGARIAPREVMPFRSLAGNYFALAMANELVVAPAVEIRNLRLGFRDSSGIDDVIHNWRAPGVGPCREMAHLRHAVFDLAIDPRTAMCPETLFPTETVVVAGGDALDRLRPGSLTLHKSRYHSEVPVPHLGHLAAVTEVDFSADGKRFVSGSADGAIKIWNAEAHPEVVRHTTHASATRVAFGNQGHIVAVAGRRRNVLRHDQWASQWQRSDNYVTVRDLRNQEIRHALQFGPGDIFGLAMDPKMTWVAAGGELKHVAVWQLDSGQLKQKLEVSGIVRALAVSADGSLLGAACGESIAKQGPIGTVVVWRVESGERVAEWQAHSGEVHSLAFSPDSTQLATAGADRNVIVWNLSDRTVARKLEHFDGDIVDLAFRPTGEDIAGAAGNYCRSSEPGVAIIWSAKDGTQRLRLTSNEGSINAVVYSADGKRLATGGRARRGSLSSPSELRIWDSNSGTELLALPALSGRQEIYTVTYDCAPAAASVPSSAVPVDESTPPVQSVPLTTDFLRESRIQREEPAAILGLAFSGDGRSIAAACEDGSALIWDSYIEQPHDTLYWNSGSILCSATSPNGKWIALAGDTGDMCNCVGRIRIYEAATGRMIREIETSAGPVVTIAFTSDSNRVITAGGCYARDYWAPAAAIPVATCAPLACGSTVGSSPPAEPQAPASPTPAVEAPAPVPESSQNSPAGPVVTQAEVDVTKLVSPYGVIPIWGGQKFATPAKLVSIEKIEPIAVVESETAQDPKMPKDGFRFTTVAVGPGDSSTNPPAQRIQFTVENRIFTFADSEGSYANLDPSKLAVGMQIAIPLLPHLKASQQQDGTIVIRPVKLLAAREQWRELEQVSESSQSPSSEAVAAPPVATCAPSAAIWAPAAAESTIAEIWNIQTGRREGELEGHTRSIYCVALALQSGEILTGGLDGTIRLWDVETRTELRRWSDLGPVTLIEVMGRTQWFAAATASGEVRLFDMTTDAPARKLEPGLGWISGLTFNAETERLYAVSDLSARPYFKSAEHATPPAAYCVPSFVDQEGLARLLPIETPAGMLHEWNLNRQDAARSRPLSMPAYSVSWNRSRNRLAIGSRREVDFWDDGATADLWLTGHRHEFVRTLVFPDGRLASFSRSDLKVWREPR